MTDRQTTRQTGQADRNVQTDRLTDTVREGGRRQAARHVEMQGNNNNTVNKRIVKSSG